VKNDFEYIVPDEYRLKIGGLYTIGYEAAMFSKFNNGWQDGETIYIRNNQILTLIDIVITQYYVVFIFFVNNIKIETPAFDRLTVDMRFIYHFDFKEVI
jgi:hypothetical protein